MKTKMKKYGLLLLAAVMLFVLIPCAALADGSTATVTTGIVTLGAQETKEVNGITYSTETRQSGTKLVFAVDENVTGEGNTDPFVVVLEGMVDVTLAAGKSLTVAYENSAKDGYVNARTFKADSNAKDAKLFLTAPGDGRNDSVSWNSGKMTMNGVTYVYNPTTLEDPNNGSTFTRPLTFDFDKNYEMYYSFFAVGELTVSAPDAYTDVLNGYSFIDDDNNLETLCPSAATFTVAENGAITLKEGKIALDEDEVVYLGGVKVTGHGDAHVTASSTTTKASIVGSATIAKTENDTTTALTIKGNPEDGVITAFVDANGVISAEAVSASNAITNSIELKDGGKCTFSVTDWNNVYYEYLKMDAGEVAVSMKAGSKLLYEAVGHPEKIFTATSDATIDTKAGEIPTTNDITIEDAPLSSVHIHNFGPWVSLDAHEHVTECLNDDCDHYLIMEHDWEKAMIIKNPTHTSYGEQRYVCYLCDATKTVQLEKLSQHDYADEWSSDEEDHWHACECGAKSDKSAHTFEEIVTSAALVATGDCENDSVYYKSCSACGALSEETFVSEKAAGHSFTNYVSDGNATCTADGTKTAKCDHCDETDTVTDAGSKMAHSFGAYTSDGNATCEADGTKSAECSVCGAKDTVTDTGSKRSHEFGAYVSDGNATCEADGTKTAKCALCGATDTQPDAGSQLAHTYEKGICTVCGAEDPDYVNLTWLWISLGAIAVLGGGFAIWWFLIRKKTK